jgi:hypothetical protein
VVGGLEQGQQVSVDPSSLLGARNAGRLFLVSSRPVRRVAFTRKAPPKPLEGLLQVTVRGRSRFHPEDVRQLPKAYLAVALQPEVNDHPLWFAELVLAIFQILAQVGDCCEGLQLLLPRDVHELSLERLRAVLRGHVGRVNHTERDRLPLPAQVIDVEVVRDLPHPGVEADGLPVTARRAWIKPPPPGVRGLQQSEEHVLSQVIGVRVVQPLAEEEAPQPHVIPILKFVKFGLAQ